MTITITQKQLEKYSAAKAYSIYNHHFFEGTKVKDIRYKCWHCNKINLTKKEVDLHHIWPREMAAKPEEWYDIKFIVILCKKCHKDVHQRLYHYKEYELMAYTNSHSNRPCECIIDGERIIYWGELNLTTPCKIEAVITKGVLKKIKVEAIPIKLEQNNDWEMVGVVGALNIPKSKSLEERYVEEMI